MTKKGKHRDERLETGVKNLDALLGGGLPQGSVTVVGGTPGAGKTILTQQICFHLATPEKRALIFQTLSEPTAKTLRYLRPMRFFDPSKIDSSVFFVDLGGILRTKGLRQATEMLMEHVRRIKPALVVVDSFKVFADLAASREELRKFTYEVAINLMAWECTGFLLGEFTMNELEVNPLSSIVDGLMMLTTEPISGEEQRLLQIIKMRGTDHNRSPQPFAISSEGINVYASRTTIQRGLPSAVGAEPQRFETGITSLDRLLPKGVPAGSSLMVAGPAGTGKTILLLEALYRGAKEFGQRGLFLTFEESEDRLCALAHNLGWDLAGEIRRGMIKIVFVPQPDVLVEKDLLLIQEMMKEHDIKRLAVNSMSVLLHKIVTRQLTQEKLYQLATLVQARGAIGLFASQTPYGSSRISRFGVEESVVDGIILLSAPEKGSARERYLEVYKLRNAQHARGRHLMEIGKGGIRLGELRPRSK